MKRREAIQYCTAMMGYGFAASLAGFSFSSCSQDLEESWTPAFFTNDEFDFVGSFADVLLPKSNTPGASDVFVGQTLDKMISSCFSQDQQQEMRSGISSLSSKCIELNGTSFKDCNEAQHTAIFKAYESEGVANPSRYLWGNVIVAGNEPPFYRKLKGMCLMAYFTSEKVGEEVLRYDPVPGDFKGCIPLAQDDRSWSL